MVAQIMSTNLHRIVDDELDELMADPPAIAMEGPKGVGKPAKTTTIAYREVLEHLYLLEPRPAWAPASSALARLAQAPKHHLADPALAARLLGADRTALLAGAELRAPAPGGELRGTNASTRSPAMDAIVCVPVIPRFTALTASSKQR